MKNLNTKIKDGTSHKIWNKINEEISNGCDCEIEIDKHFDKVKDITFYNCWDEIIKIMNNS